MLQLFTLQYQLIQRFCNMQHIKLKTFEKEIRENREYAIYSLIPNRLYGNSLENYMLHVTKACLRMIKVGI